MPRIPMNENPLSPCLLVTIYMRRLTYSMGTTGRC